MIETSDHNVCNEVLVIVIIFIPLDNCGQGLWLYPRKQPPFPYICWNAVRCIIVMFKLYMMTSSNGNIFRATGPFWEEFTGLRLNKRLSKR